MAVAENVTILKLPPHSSDVLQPLDCSTMKSMKVHWEDALVRWQRLHTGAKLPKSEFARLLTEIWDNLNPVILQNGFRKTGLYPVDRNAIPKDRFDIIMWSKWEKKLKEESEEFIQEQIQAQADKTKTKQSLETLHPYYGEVPSLVSLVLNHMNSQNNNNLMDSTKDDAGKRIVTHQKEIEANFQINNTVEDPGKYILKHPNQNTSGQCNQSCLRILDCKIIKSGNNEENKKKHVNVEFEELLLKSIARNDPPKLPRKRVPKGAEILTYKDVINTMKREKEEKELEIERKLNAKKIKTEKKEDSEEKHQK